MNNIIFTTLKIYFEPVCAVFKVSLMISVRMYVVEIPLVGVKWMDGPLPLARLNPMYLACGTK